MALIRAPEYKESDLMSIIQRNALKTMYDVKLKYMENLNPPFDIDLQRSEIIALLKLELATKKKHETTIKKKVNEQTKIYSTIQPAGKSFDEVKKEDSAQNISNQYKKIEEAGYLRHAKDNIKKAAQLQIRKEQAKGFEALIVLTNEEKKARELVLDDCSYLMNEIDDVKDVILEMREKDIWLRGEKQHLENEYKGIKVFAHGFTIIEEGENLLSSRHSSTVKVAPHLSP